LRAHGTPEELAQLAWKAAREGAPWAIQMIFNRLEPPSAQTHPQESTHANSTDYSRLTTDEIQQLESLLERARNRVVQIEGGESPTPVVQAWHVLEPATPFVHGIHVESICQHPQAVTEGRIRNLIINVPPGHATSLLTAVFWPAWVWIDRHQTRWLFASYAANLSVRDSLKCRRLIESEWYQQNWGDRYQLTNDQNQKQRFENDRTGYRIATSVGGSATGEPHSVDQAESDTERRTAVEWFNGTMSTRLNDFASGHKIVIQQRLHEADLTGDLLAKGDFELLCLPAEFEPERRCTTSIGWTDPRVEAGELLWPDKVTAAHLEALKVSLGSYRYAGQYQQRPAPAEGGIFKRSWWATGGRRTWTYPACRCVCRMDGC
jgi:hypothetical protein